MIQDRPTIRRAEQADAAELARLRWDFSEAERLSSGEDFSRFLATFERFWAAAAENGRWAVWVAEAAGSLVGNVWVQHIGKVPRPGEPDMEYGYVTNVYVEPEYRSQGMGAALMQAAVHHAREQRFEFLIVWPSEESVRFYERLGFRRSAEAMELGLDAG